LGPPDCRVADFTDIQTAINALPPTGGKVFVKAGTYVVPQTILIQQSNVQLQGEGMGITNIVAAATMTAAPAIRVYKQQARNVLPLLADTAKGETETSATLTSANATHLTSGNYVLLFSNKPVDTEDPQKRAGEVKQIEAVDLATGTIMFDDQVYDGYLVSDGAATVRITMLQNVTLADLSVTTLAPFYTGNEASISCRFIDNLQTEHMGSHHTYVLFETIRLERARGLTPMALGSDRRDGVPLGEVRRFFEDYVRGNAERRLQHPGAAFGAQHAQPGRIPVRAAHPKLLTVSSPLGSSPLRNRSPPLDGDPREDTSTE